jgi:hypothetical protein
MLYSIRWSHRQATHDVAIFDAMLAMRPAPKRRHVAFYVPPPRIAYVRIDSSLLIGVISLIQQYINRFGVENLLW